MKFIKLTLKDGRDVFVNTKKITDIIRQNGVFVGDVEEDKLGFFFIRKSENKYLNGQKIREVKSPIFCFYICREKTGSISEKKKSQKPKKKKKKK